MQFYQLSQTSLAKSGSSVVEEYIPLYFSDGTTFNAASGSPGVLVSNGGGSQSTTTPTSASTLFTLSSSFPNNQKYAFEATIYSSSTSYAIHALLWDITAGASVSGSEVTTTSTTATVMRSGTFTLIPGHSYGLNVWITSGGTLYISDASLIVFGQ